MTAPNRRPTLSKMKRRPLPRAALVATAFFMPSRFRPSALRSTLPSLAKTPSRKCDGDLSSRCRASSKTGKSSGLDFVLSDLLRPRLSHAESLQPSPTSFGLCHLCGHGSARAAIGDEPFPLAYPRALVGARGFFSGQDPHGQLGSLAVRTSDSQLDVRGVYRLPDPAGG